MGALFNADQGSEPRREWFIGCVVGGKFLHMHSPSMSAADVPSELMPAPSGICFALLQAWRGGKPKPGAIVEAFKTLELPKQW